MNNDKNNGPDAPNTPDPPDPPRPPRPPKKSVIPTAIRFEIWTSMVKSWPEFQAARLTQGAIAERLSAEFKVRVTDSLVWSWIHQLKLPPIKRPIPKKRAPSEKKTNRGYNAAGQLVGTAAISSLQARVRFLEERGVRLQERVSEVENKVVALDAILNRILGRLGGPA